MKSSDSFCSSSGCVGVLPACMSSMGLTMPRPNIWAHSLLTIARAKYLFSAAVIHLVKIGRSGSSAFTLASSYCRYFAVSVLDDSGRTLLVRDLEISIMTGHVVAWAGVVLFTVYYLVIAVTL